MIRQSNAATASESTGAPVCNVVQFPLSKRCVSPRPAKASARGMCCSARTFTQRLPLPLKTSCERFFWLTQTSSVGGLSVIEQTADAVMPWRPSGPAEVIRLTAAPRQLIPSRKASAVTSIGVLLQQVRRVSA